MRTGASVTCPGTCVWFWFGGFRCDKTQNRRSSFRLSYGVFQILEQCPCVAGNYAVSKKARTIACLSALFRCFFAIVLSIKKIMQDPVESAGEQNIQLVLKTKLFLWIYCRIDNSIKNITCLLPFETFINDMCGMFCKKDCLSHGFPMLLIETLRGKSEDMGTITSLEPTEEDAKLEVSGDGGHLVMMMFPCFATQQLWLISKPMWKRGHQTTTGCTKRRMCHLVHTSNNRIIRQFQTLLFILFQVECSVFIRNGYLEFNQIENISYIYNASHETLLSCVKNIFQSIAGKSDNLTDLLSNFETDIQNVKDDILKVTQDPASNGNAIFQSGLCRSSLIKYSAVAESFYSLLGVLNENKTNRGDLNLHLQIFYSAMKNYLKPDAKLYMMDHCFYFQRFLWWRKIKMRQCEQTKYIRHRPQQHSKDIHKIYWPYFIGSEESALVYLRLVLRHEKFTSRCPDDFWRDFVSYRAREPYEDPYFVEEKFCVWQDIGGGRMTHSGHGYALPETPSGRRVSQKGISKRG